MTEDPFAVCDVDRDGDCDGDDFSLFRVGRESCINQPNFHPGFDVNGDGCVDDADQAVLFNRVVTIVIDVKPGEPRGTVNLASRGVIPLAVIGSAHLDVLQLDPSSVRFGPLGTREAPGRGHIEDVNSDGFADMVLHFRTKETGIQCGDSSVFLTGQTTAGVFIEGDDLIQTTNCKP